MLYRQDRKYDVHTLTPKQEKETWNVAKTSADDGDVIR